SFRTCCAARCNLSKERRESQKKSFPRQCFSLFKRTVVRTLVDMKVKPIPDGYHTLTPYLFIRGAAEAIDFYKKAFNATEIMRMPGPGGRIGHAEIKVGDSVIMLADENLEMNARSPKTVGGSPMLLHLYVPDVDAMFAQAVAAGAKVTRPIANQFYGDR